MPHGTPTGKSYRFATFQQLVDRVPPDRICACLDELGPILQSAAIAAEMVYDLAGMPRPPRLLTLPPELEWIDDGKRTLRANIRTAEGQPLLAVQYRPK